METITFVWIVKMKPFPALYLLTAICCYWTFSQLLSICSAQSNQQWSVLRWHMVEHEVEGAGITNPRVVRAMRETPRHLFVPVEQRRLAYIDMALPIGESQTISPPFVVAYMTEQLDPQPDDKVLEIGTGSGYQAAILSPLVAKVYSIEIVEPLARRARSTLQELGYTNIETKAGDGYLGWPEFAPFDKIIVTCSPEEIPQALVDQLEEGGRLVIPLGERFQQSLYLFVKSKGKLERQLLEATFFVPMTGQAESLRKKTSTAPLTELVNGEFEETNDRHHPAGWYYVRQAETISDQSAPQGNHILRLTNRDRGRHSQLLQVVGVDGERVDRIELRYWVRSQGVKSGQTDRQVPQMRLTFYDENRTEITSHQSGTWTMTTDWKHIREVIEVPPETRLAVLMAGMFGATGRVDLDGIVIEDRTRE